MEQNTPSSTRHWWSDSWFWIGAATGVAIIWAYKLGRKLGYLEGRGD